MWKLALILVSLFYPLSASAQNPEPSMAIGPVQVRIGMPQEALVKSLERYYKLLRISGMGDYEGYVLSTIDSPQNNPEIIGSVTFRNGRLHSAGRDWRASVRSAWELTDILNTILTQMKERGEQVALIKTQNIKEPAHNFQIVSILFTNREVTILASEADGDKNVSISEAICATRLCQK